MNRNFTPNFALGNGGIFIKFLSIACRRLKKKLWLPALIAINLAIIAYIAVSSLVPHLYGAEAQILVVGDDIAADNLVRIATSRAVSNRLITEFGLSSTTDQVLGSLEAERMGDSSCVRLRVLCQDAETSRILTEALAYFSTDMMAQLYADTVTFTYDAPELPTVSEGLDPLPVAATVFVAVLLLGIVILCLPLMGGRLLIDKKTVKDLLGLPVLAVIPGERPKKGGAAK